MRVRTTIGFGAALGVAAAFAACSLHLDKSKISGRDGGAGSGGSGGGSGGSSGSGGSGGVMEAGSECDANAQCKSDAACIEGACNNGNCVYQLCPVTQACTASSCDQKSQVCSAPQPYGFVAGVINVGQNLGCGNNAERCVAAMGGSTGDYLFVGTASGLKAWQVNNPKAPVSIPVSPPLPFSNSISRVVSNGKRVLVLGPTVGGNTLNVAWVDLPTDAAPKQIQATSVGLQFSDTYSTSYPAESDNFFLVKNDQTAFYPSARLEPPLQDNDPVSLSACNGLPSGANIVGASGNRLVQFRVDSTTGPFKPIFAFENDAGTATSQYGGDADLSADTGNVPTSLSAHRFESTYNGGLLWATNEIVNVDGGTQEADAVVMRWPVLNTSDTTFNGKRSVVIQQYPVYSYNTRYAGEMAQIDPTTALVTAAYSGDPTGQVTVQAVKRSGDTLSITSPTPPFTIAVDPNTIGVTAGRSFGYVLVPSSGSTPPDTKAYIFDPNCK